MTYLVIFGTRPEVIKLAPVIKLLKGKATICSTGQHKELLQQALDIFNIIPDYNLNLMTKEQSLSSLTARILTSLQTVIDKVKPSSIIVHGDTTSCLTGALVAFYNKLPIYHIEAGMRTYDISNPFPEETNRQIVSKLATHHFAPTTKESTNLLREGIASRTITVTGNTGIDSILWMKDKLSSKTQITEKTIGLITLHRREQDIDKVFSLLNKIAKTFTSINFVFCAHPRVQKHTHKLQNIEVINPLPYDKFVLTMLRSAIIITDSGGIQEEAPALGIPLIVLRDKSERYSSTGTKEDVVLSTIDLSLKTPISPYFPYGKGNAAEKIVMQILKQQPL